MSNIDYNYMAPLPNCRDNQPIQNIDGKNCQIICGKLYCEGEKMVIFNAQLTEIFFGYLGLAVVTLALTYFSFWRKKSQ